MSVRALRSQFDDHHTTAYNLILKCHWFRDFYQAAKTYSVILLMEKIGVRGWVSSVSYYVLNQIRQTIKIFYRIKLEFLWNQRNNDDGDDNDVGGRNVDGNNIPFV